MLMLVAYDVETTTKAGRGRLRKVARACQDFGIRVQLSVFECEVDPARWAALRATLLGLIDPKTDSLRVYHLGGRAHRIEHHGAKPPIDPDGPLIV